MDMDMVAPHRGSHAIGYITKRAIGLPDSVTNAWPYPNYINPVRRDVNVLYVLMSIFLFSALTCVLARLYVRLAIRRYFGLDDVFIIFSVVGIPNLMLAAIGAVGVTTCVILGTRFYDWDRHIYDVHIEAITPSEKTLYISKLFWSFTSNSVRASVVCTYYRLLNHIGLNKYRWILHVNSLFMLGVFLEQQFTSIFACYPIKDTWAWPYDPAVKCINVGTSLAIGASINTLSEFIVACLPIPIIMQMDMDPRQRWPLIGLLCGGFLVVICGSLRTYYMTMGSFKHDQFWWAMPHWICSEIEIDVAMICACVPTLRPVLGRAFSRGPSAVKLPNSRTPMLSRGKSKARRAKSLFEKHAITTNDTFSTNQTRSLSSGNGQKDLNLATAQHDVDLEGIGVDDGFGYCVTIATGYGTKVRKRWDIRNRIWHYYPEVELDEDESIAPKNRKDSRFSRSSGTRRKSKVDDGSLSEFEKPHLQAQPLKSLDMQSGQHGAVQGHRKQSRNSYGKEVPSKYEEDIEIALDISQLDNPTDGAFVKQEPSLPAYRRSSDQQPMRRISSQAGLPEILRPRPDGLYSMPRWSVSQSGSRVEQYRPQTSLDTAAMAHRVRQSQESVRVGITTQTIARRPSVERQTPIPPPLPAAGRNPRSISPIVKPLNSSQLWATSSQGSRRTRSNEQPIQQQQHKQAEKHTQNTRDEPVAIHPVLHTSQPDAVLSKQTPVSRSSMHATNGGPANISMQQGPDEVDDDDSSDEDLGLPFQRHSGPGIARDVTPPPWVPKIKVGNYG